jgi:hypothetical protein
MSFHDDGDEGFAPDALDVLDIAPTSGNSSKGGPPSTVKTGQPTLALTQVLDGWERVKKRVKGRNQMGPKTQAMLNDYSVVAVEEAMGDVVVVIQATHDLHYKYLLASTYCEDVEWALQTEFNQKCRVRLLPPGQTPPPGRGIAQTMGRQSTSAAAPVAPQQSAHRERPATRQSHSPQNAAYEKPQHSVQESVAALSSEVPAPSSEVEQPLARKNIVRENSNTVALAQSVQPVPSLEEIQRKASVDPVVQKVKEMFKAEIREIRPK